MDTTRVLTANISQIKSLISIFPRTTSVLIAGQPGIGKSDLFEQIAKDWNAKYDRHETATWDAVDVKGCPFPIGHATEFLPPKALLELTDQADYKGPVVANFDDIGAAEEAVFNALLGVFLQRYVGPYKIRENVLLCGTTNRAEDRAGARELTTALNNRFVHFNLSPEPEEWVQWAIRNDVDPNIIGYIRTRPDKLNTFDAKSPERAFATPRSVTQASKLQIAVGLNHKDLILAIASAVGPAWALEYKAWLDRTRSLVTAEEILKDPKNCRIPSEDEVDVNHATIASLVHAIAKDPSMKTIKAGFVYSVRLPHADMGAVLASDVNRIFTNCQDSDVQAKIAQDKDFEHACNKFTEIMG